MEILIPKKVTITELGKNHARVAIEPCYPGYGTTLGNALRRVLLSSLDGSAVVAVRVHNAPHEFGAIPNVKEDVLEIVLNVKNFRVKMHGAEEVKLTVKHKGEGKVKAGDISPDSQVEILNPELVLATVTDKNTEFEMDLYVKRGKGFDPIEARGKGREEIGVIDVDAIFSPVRAVSFRNENVRVGQMTNWDQVNLDIATDGSLTPEEAFAQASNILLDHFQYIAKYKEMPATVAEETAAAIEEPVKDAGIKSAEEPEEKPVDEEKPKSKKKKGESKEE